MLFKVIKMPEQFEGKEATLGYISACAGEVEDKKLFCANIKNSALVKINGLSSEICQIQKDYYSHIYYGYNNRLVAIIKVVEISFKKPKATTKNLWYSITGSTSSTSISPTMNSQYFILDEAEGIQIAVPAEAPVPAPQNQNINQDFRVLANTIRNLYGIIR